MTSSSSPTIPLRTSPLKFSPFRTSPTHSSPSSLNRGLVINANAYPIDSPSFYHNRRYSPSLITLKRKKSHESDDDDESNGTLLKRHKNVHPYLTLSDYDDEYEDDDGDGELFDCLYCGKAKKCVKFPKWVQFQLKKHVQSEVPVSCTACVRRMK
jgi:hypothetical protein